MYAYFFDCFFCMVAFHWKHTYYKMRVIFQNGFCEGYNIEIIFYVGNKWINICSQILSHVKLESEFKSFLWHVFIYLDLSQFPYFNVNFMVDHYNHTFSNIPDTLELLLLNQTHLAKLQSRQNPALALLCTCTCMDECD